MPLDQLLLTILGATILVNVLLVVYSALRSRSLQRSRRPARAAMGPARVTGTPRAQQAPSEPIGVFVTPFSGADREDDGRVAAAVEAFVAGVSGDATGSARLPTPEEVLARRQEAVGGGRVLTAVDLRSVSADPPLANGQVPEGLAGLADAAMWEQMVREESARAARFGRPSSVVTASLPHLDDLAERWGGRETADRVLAETARLLDSERRAVDRIARLGDARFGILLPETSELGASRYAERARAVVDAWLTSAGLSVRLEFAWSSVPISGDADARHRVPGRETRDRDLK